MTALAFLTFGSRTLLLAGEGPFLRFYEQDTHRCLLSERIFRSQAIHGICTESKCGCKPPFNRVVIWGGRSVCHVIVDYTWTHPGRYDPHLRQTARDIQADDWIFDVCFVHVVSNGLAAPSPTYTCKAVLVTAHNALLALNLQTDPNDETALLPSVECIAAGPRSILYSAHVIWLQDGRGLVAAGTVFGEVLLWSFSTNHSTFFSKKVVPGRLHHTFTGHEGSVFGVQISEEAVASNVGYFKRVLASCSDDRAIRIWDISDLEHCATQDEVQGTANGRSSEHWSDEIQSKTSLCLATVSGHSSRIWGLRFLYHHVNAWRLMSYGEDSTAQVWQLGLNPSARESSKKSDPQALFLRHLSTYSFHSGKNIWAVATDLEPDVGLKICSGGADGRIVSYLLEAEDVLWNSHLYSGQWSIKEAYGSVDTAPNQRQVPSNIPLASERTSSAQRVLFEGLQGKWLLRRKLKSTIPPYSSGSFSGTAILEARGPTNEAYDLEYLYTESGQFATEQGFIMEATRRYVYRFQENTNTISAWFVCTEDPCTVDYLFHLLDFGDLSRNLESNRDDGMVALGATGRHLCIDDDYQASYVFKMRDAALTQWKVTYVVKGPSKDYIADAQYVCERSPEQSTTITEATKPKIKTSQASNTPSDAAEAKNSSLKPDSFKSYAWVDEDSFITSTESGNILAGTVLKKAEYYNGRQRIREYTSTLRWEFIGHLDKLKSSSIITSIRSCGAALLSGNEGMIYMYQRSRQIHPIIKLPSKVACLSARKLPQDSHCLSHEEKEAPLTIAIFAACLGSSTAHAVIVGIGQKDPNDTHDNVESKPKIQIFQHVLVDLPPNFVATSYLLIDSEDYLILGSRSGRLAIYDLLAGINGIVECSYVSDNIHGRGEDTITSIESVPVVTSDNCSTNAYILTTGRDGKYSIHKISVERADPEKSHISLQTVHTCAPPFGPNIEGVQFVGTTNDLLLWGFRSKHFVVWNETQKTEVMAVECGGASRNWSYVPSFDGDGGGSFVWTKASVCNIQLQAQASYQVAQHGGHGREIKAMAISPQVMAENGLSSRLIATGAEDTAVGIHGYNLERTKDKDTGFKCLEIFTDHKTGIQQVKWSPDGKYLFSAAGLEEFFIWRVRSVPCIGTGVVCEAQFPPVTESCDLRIMDFDIIEIDRENDESEGSAEHQYILSLVYSDSSVRVRNQRQSQLLKQADTPRSTTTTPLTSNNPSKSSCPAHTAPPA